MHIGGSVAVPGDKSLTHRVLLLGAMADGRTVIRGGLTSFDARSSARVLRQLGVAISPLRRGAAVILEGHGRLHRPLAPLDCGNSGTTARLLLGLLSAHHFHSRVTGDASLRRRPMRRVTEPLSRMGARFDFLEGADGLPLAVEGGALQPITYEMPVSSAQIKSALLFAGVAGNVAVSIREPHGRSRDHTERLLRGMDFQVDSDDATGWIRFTPGGSLRPFDVVVPGDASSAAFLLGAALLAERGSLWVTGVGVNPTRTGFLAVLARMGARVTVEPVEDRLGEPVGDIAVEPSHLSATEVAGAEIPGLIDEIPLLAVLAARAEGTSVFHDVGELRVKESDRLRLLGDNLRAVGVSAEVEGNTLWVTGGDGPLAGRVRTDGDHRIAMAFAVLGTVHGARITVDDPDCAGVSFPDFHETLHGIRTQ